MVRSHAEFGWQNCKDVTTHWIGPVLCYSFGREKLKRCDIRDFNVKDNDTLIFCFGEIDCRCHVHKHITPERSYQMIINDMMDDYVEAIKLNITESGLTFKNICIYNVVPTVIKRITNENPGYPFLGTDEERKAYVSYFNECIKQKCEENEWIFFNVFDHYADENGFLNKSLSDGEVHIRDGRYIQKFINKYLL